MVLCFLKNRYRTHRFAIRAISVFRVKFNVEFICQAVNFSIKSYISSLHVNDLWKKQNIFLSEVSQLNGNFGFNKMGIVPEVVCLLPLLTAALTQDVKESQPCTLHEGAIFLDSRTNH